jgi:hypothetical protein
MLIYHYVSPFKLREKNGKENIKLPFTQVDQGASSARLFVHLHKHPPWNATYGELAHLRSNLLVETPTKRSQWADHVAEH